MKPGEGKKVNVLKALDFAANLIILFITLTMIISFVIGPYIVFNSSMGREIAGKSSHFYIFFVGLAFSFESNMQSLFISEWVIYLSIFTILAVTVKNRAAESFRAFFNPNPFSNNLKAAISIFSIAVVIVLAVDWIQYNAGIGTGNLPQMNSAELLCVISHAPLSEELGFRLSLIGLFSIFLLRGWRKRVPLIDYLISPAPTLLARLGDTAENRRRVHFTFLPLIAASAIIFGLAHIIPASVWEVGKATEAAAAGIMLGIAYAYYNIGVAILVHWAFNYYSNAIYIFEEEVVNIGLSSAVDVAVIVLGTLLIVNVLARSALKKG